MIAAATRGATDVLLWSGGLIVLVIGLGLVILALRRAMLSKQGGTAEAGLFDSLREMRDSGAISQQEYDAARKNMVSRAAGKVGLPSGAGPPAKKTIGIPGAALGEVRARPGFDLTGRPLPKSDRPPGNIE